MNSEKGSFVLENTVEIKTQISIFYAYELLPCNHFFEDLLESFYIKCISFMDVLEVLVVVSILELEHRIFFESDCRTLFNVS